MKLTDNHLMLEINHISFDTETFTLQLTGKLDSPLISKHRHFLHMI